MEGVLGAFAGTKGKEKEEQKELSNKIASEMEEILSQIKATETKYNLTSDSDLIDALIYEELSLRARYSYLLRLAKENRLKYEGNFARSD
jgi:hypothetical protein